MRLLFALTSPVVAEEEEPVQSVRLNSSPPCGRMAAPVISAAAFSAGKCAIAAGIEMDVSGPIGDDRTCGIGAKPAQDRCPVTRRRHEIDRFAVAMLRGPACAGNNGAAATGGNHPHSAKLRFHSSQHCARVRREAGA